MRSRSRYKNHGSAGKIHNPPRRELRVIPRKYQLIWRVVREIPEGMVSTYGRIADLCGLFGHARLVGYALHNLPRGSDVPWHRVINAQGKISLSDLDGLAERQRRLLRKEGIVFLKDVVSLSKYGWPRDHPPPGIRRR